MTSRTQAEILDRFRTAGDFFGAAGEVLVEAMTADTLRQISPAAAEDAFIGAPAIPPVFLPSAAADYLDFAVQKILHHRGLSAQRAVIKLHEFAWLLGRDDVVEAMDKADYPQYGAPKVRAFADGMGWPLLDLAERDALGRMAQGLPCRDGCDEGCGQ